MGHVSQISEETLLGEIQRRLLDDFPSVSPLVVDTLIRAEHARFVGSRIRDFIPLFVEKRARRDLTLRCAVNPPMNSTVQVSPATGG
jgi:hypothetical protein